MLDLVYTTISSAYRAEPCPHLGYSDYSRPANKQMKTWPEGAISALQDCFECTLHTASVTDFISKCIDDVTVIKTITTRSNQRPWMTTEERALLRARDIASKARDKEALSTARATLARAIRDAKQAHAQKIHGHLRDSRDTRQLW